MKVFGNYYYFCRSKEQCKTTKRKTSVVYCLHWHTNYFTVCANGKQNSGLSKFCPEIAFNICTDQFHLRKNGKVQRRRTLVAHLVGETGDLIYPVSKLSTLGVGVRK